MQAKQIPVRFITASLWKNAYNRMFDKQLKEHYKKAKGICTPHQMDAALIGVFGMYSLSDLKPFEDFRLDTLLKQIQKCQKK